MKIIDLKTLSKDIHFPILRAVYKVAPKRSWWQKIIKFFTYHRWYEFMSDYILWVPSIDKYAFIPTSFVCDNASVPKVLSSLFNSDGMLLLGSYFHDFGYRYQGLFVVDMSTGELVFVTLNKKEFDRIFKDLCIYESGFKKASWIASTGLKLFGFIGWKQNRKRAAVLKKDFPELFVKE